MIQKTCELCKRQVNRLFLKKWCHPCFCIDLGRQAIQVIRLEFSSTGVFNQLIFKTCCSDLEQFKVRMRDIAMLARVAEILGDKPIPEPSSWQEVLALSQRLGICYSAEKSPTYKIKCPVLRWGFELKIKGRADKRVKARKNRFELALLDFDPNSRQIIRIYLNQLANNSSPHTILKTNLRLRRFGRYLKSGEGDFLNPPSGTLQAYFDFIKPGIANAHTIRYDLRRFYVWSLKQGHSWVNPFDGWTLPRQSRVCNQCKKTRIFSLNEHLCDSCHGGSQYLKRLDRWVQLYRAPWSYNQDLFDLYIKYLRRSRISASCLVDSRALAELLNEREIPTLRSWRAVVGEARALAVKQNRSFKEGEIGRAHV